MQFSATDGTDSHGYEDLQDKSERSSCQSCSSCPNYAFPAKELFTAEVAEGRGEDANAIHRKSSLRPPASSAVELMFWLRRSRPGHFARFRGHCSLRAAASGRETIPAFPNPLTSGIRIVSIRYGIIAMTNNQTRMTNEGSGRCPVICGRTGALLSGHWPPTTGHYSLLAHLAHSSPAVVPIKNTQKLSCVARRRIRSKTRLFPCDSHMTNFGIWHMEEITHFAQSSPALRAKYKRKKVGTLARRDYLGRKRGFFPACQLPAFGTQGTDLARRGDTANVYGKRKSVTFCPILLPLQTATDLHRRAAGLSMLEDGLRGLMPFIRRSIHCRIPACFTTKFDWIR